MLRGEVGASVGVRRQPIERDELDWLLPVWGWDSGPAGWNLTVLKEGVESVPVQDQVVHDRDAQKVARFAKPPGDGQVLGARLDVRGDRHGGVVMLCA